MDFIGLRQNINEYIGVKTSGLPVEYNIISEEKCDGYSRVLIQYAGNENDLIPAYLLLPEGDGVFPAVLIHHQHNGERHYGKSEVCGLVGNTLQAFGPTLVKKGFIVLAPDSICFEDRRNNMKGIVQDGDNDFFQHFNEMCYRILNGSILMKKVIEDANIGIELLCSLNMVDNNRIGLLGHSYGGNTVLFQAALNDKVKYACSSGAACTYKNKMEYGTGIEMAEVIPGFSNHFDIPDLIKCIAPRKLLLVSASDDKYSRDADFIEKQGREVYKALGFNDNLEHYRYNGGHELTQERYLAIIQWIEEVANKHVMNFT